MIRIFTFSLCLLIYNNVYSQYADLSVYPIRVDHKWGYAKFYGTFVDTLIAPRYDYIGDINLAWNVSGDQPVSSPFRLFEIDEKVGLLNNFLQESLPNKYNRIRPISKEFFAVEIDQGFQLINEKEEILFDGIAYEDIRGDKLGDELGYLFVRKNRKWAVRNKAGELILDHEFTAIQSAGISGYFKVQSKSNTNYWTLIDATGALVLPEAYGDVEVINKKVIKIRKKHEAVWEYFIMKKDRNKFVKQAGTYKSIKKVTKDLLALVPYDLLLSKEVILQSLKEDYKEIKRLEIKTVGGSEKKIVPDFYPLDENYGLQSDIGEEGNTIAYKLIDGSGTILSEAFDSIRVTNKKEIYFVCKSIRMPMINHAFERWGIFQPVKNTVTPIKVAFNEILDFEDDMAVTRNGKKYGAIAVKQNKIDTLPCIFETVYNTGKQTVQVQTTDERAVIYKLTADGKFTEDLLVNNTIVFSESGKRNIKEATHKKLRKFNVLIEEENLKLGNLGYRYENGRLVIFNEKQLIIPTNIIQEIIGVEAFSADILALKLKTNPIKNKATKVLSSQSFSQIILFSITENSIISKFPMLGFHPFLKENKYTSFIDANGKMGLMDRSGKQIVVNGQPLRFLYIGPFHVGRARFCLGDKLFADKNSQLGLPSKYTLGTVSSFISDFNMRKITTGKFAKTNKEVPLYTLSKEGTGKWGYVDERGNIQIEAKYDYTEDFMPNNERALVYKTYADKSSLRQRATVELIDKNGKKLSDNETDILDISPRMSVKDNSFFQVAVGKTPTFYFNQKGHQIFVNPTRMRPFTEGLALFRSTDNKWGFVDATGKILIEPIFKYARPFSDGLALVIDESGFCSFIDQQGKVVFETEFTEKQHIGLGDFHEGRCWFKGKKGWFWGCFDKTGKVIIEPRYYYQIKAKIIPEPAASYILPMDFKNGVASTQMLDEHGKPAYTIIDWTGKNKIAIGKFNTIGPFDKHGIAVYTNSATKEKGLLNKDGEILFPPSYQKILPFVNGLAKVQSKTNHWGLIDSTGKVLLKTQYKEIGVTAEGLTPVKNNDLTWSYVGLDGKIKIPGPYKSVTPFQNGMSFVHQEKKDLLIDKSGNNINLPIGKPLFFSEGILGVLKNEKAVKYRREYYFADDTGNNILGRTFKEISPFQLGVAKVRVLASESPNGKKRQELLGAINKRGVMIVPPKFRNLHLQPDGNIVINPQRFYGLISNNGKELLEPIYDMIVHYAKDNIFRVEQGEKIGYFTLENDEVEWIWEMRY